MENKEQFLTKAREALEPIYDSVYEENPLMLSCLEPQKTCLVIMDMINGFVKEGNLSSNRMERIIPKVKELMEYGKETGMEILAFADCHEGFAAEFQSYPVHCLKGSFESEIIEELKSIADYKKIEKNSTNGFVSIEFVKWMQDHQQINQFLVVGDCTDICVMQFCLTLKAYFNQSNQTSRIIVPIDGVETFELLEHNASLTNMMALYFMKSGGVEVVKSLERE